MNTPAAWSERATLPSPWDACAWSEAGQTQRFLAVLRHLQLREDDTILDFGCGTGRLRAFLPRTVTYHAYDTAPGMLDRVDREITDAIVHEQLPDVIFDHVVAVGPFNLAHEWTLDQTLDTLADLWANHARRTLAVSLYRGRDHACLSYDPQTLAWWAHTLGVRRFVIDASYLDNDALLVMHR